MRMLIEMKEMKGVEKLVLIDKIHKFKYLKLQFGQIVYGRAIRKNVVFFIKVHFIGFRVEWWKSSTEEELLDIWLTEEC